MSKSTFSFLTVEERAALSPEDFGDPERRLFPVLTQEDVNLAPRRISFFPNFESMKDRLIAIATRKGFTVPDVWITKTEVAEEVADEATASAFSTSTEVSDSIAEFELDADTKKPTEDGWVYRTGKIFEAGQYKDKKFEITPEELCEAIADFKPVDLDLEHMPTILDGKLGKLEAVALGADGWSLIGTVKLPKWLDEQLGDADRKVSATWDRVTKKLNKLALVRNPRVKDAAVMAAFMANEFSDTLEGVSEAEMSNTIETLIEKHISEFASKTWDGRSLFQSMHDMAGRSGAICVETEEKFNEAKEAGFVSAAEAKSIQQIHDTALRGGAKCSFIKERSGNSPSYYSTEEKNNMTLEDVKNFFKGMDEEVPVKETETSSEDKKTADLSAREEAVKASEKAIAEKLAAFEQYEEARKIEESKVAEAKAEEVVEDVVEHSETAPSERELKLEAELETLRQEGIKRDAEKFADAEIKAERAFPAEKEAIVALFTQAAIDDKTNEAKIGFNNGGEAVELGRVDAFKALYAVRKPHNLTYEEVSDLNANILVATYSEDEDFIGEAEKQAKEYAEKRRKVLAAQK